MGPMSTADMIDNEKVTQKIFSAELESNVENGRQDTEIRRMATAVNSEATNMPQNKTSEVWLEATTSLEVATDSLSGRKGLTTETMASRPSSLNNQGFELRLVLEFCDCGNLKQALDLVCTYFNSWLHK